MDRKGSLPSPGGQPLVHWRVNRAWRRHADAGRESRVSQGLHASERARFAQLRRQWKPEGFDLCGRQPTGVDLRGSEA